MFEIITRSLLLLNTFASKDYFNFKKHPDAGLNIIQLVTKHGYPIETHTMVTEDGYHLTTYRIPHGRNQNQTNPYPVLLVHGMCGTAENFLAFGPTKSLGYFLADRGFDVWLMNNRGNIHSRKHDSLNPDTEKKFWDFSFHEVGIIDIPTNIDYILKTTRKTKLAFVGHSQGTTDYFALLTTRTEYNEKINVGVNLAPSAFLWDTASLEVILAKHLDLLNDIADYLEIWELLPGKLNSFARSLLRFLCSDVNVLVDFCAYVAHAGFETWQFESAANEKYASSYYENAEKRMAYLSRMSKYTLHRITRLNDSITFNLNSTWTCEKAEFKQFDYGKSKNMEIYGSPSPPMYDLRNITSPTAYFYSTFDFVYTEENISKMISLTKNAIVYKLSYPIFNHIDYIAGKDLMRLVHEPMYYVLLKYVS